MTPFKTTLAAAAAVALGATALISTSAFAKVLPLTHLQTFSQSNFGAVQGHITTQGFPGAGSNTAPSRPSASAPPVTPTSPTSICGQHPGQCG
jgi:hypothetical protein